MVEKHFKVLKFLRVISYRVEDNEKIWDQVGLGFQIKIQDQGSRLGFKGMYSGKLVPNHQLVQRTEKDNQMRMRMK